MIKNKALRNHLLLLLLFWCCSIHSLPAQLNLNAGYTLSYFEDNITSDILQRYNDRKPWLEQNLNRPAVKTGLVVGLQYKFQPVGLFVQWTNKTNRTEATGLDPNDETDFFRELSIKYNSYSAGLVFFIRSFSFGGTVDYNHYFVQTSHTATPDKYKIGTAFTWSSHFFLNFRLYNSSNMSLGLQPYVHLPWARTNIFALEQELNSDFAATANPTDYPVDFRNVGLSLIFYNGEQ